MKQDENCHRDRGDTHFLTFCKLLFLNLRYTQFGYKKYLKIRTSPVSNFSQKKGLVVGAYSSLNFQRIMHSLFLKLSLFVINLRTICPNFAYVKLATCAETVLGGY